MANIIGKNKPGKRTGVMNKEKPFVGYRNGRGMPSAREPFDEYTSQGRKNHESAFGKNKEWYEKRDKGIIVCMDEDCGFHSKRKYSGCVKHSNKKDCKI